MKVKINYTTSRKIYFYYMIVSSSLFLVIQIWFHGEIYNFAPIFYAFLCPTLFFGIRFSLVFKISEYVETKYPELMKKNLIGSSGFRGSTLNIPGINKNEFLAKKDNYMDEMLRTYSLITRLVLISFFILILFSVLGSILRY